MQELSDRLALCYTAVVHDVIRGAPASLRIFRGFTIC
jgi:hypothetical protein